MELEAHCSERPWQLCVYSDGPNEGGLVVMDAKGEVVCALFALTGDGPMPYGRDQLNGALIVEAVNTLAKSREQQR